MAAANPGRFETTHWSLVVAAGVPGARRRESLAKLCEAYWGAVHAYILRSGIPRDEAADLTQEFFATFLEKNSVRSADPHRGRFRSFLLASVRHFLCNAWDRQHARKRGGGITIVPLESDDGDGPIRYQPASDSTPERVFEHHWALTLVERAMTQLAEEHQRSGRENVFTHLRPFLDVDASGDDYADAVRALGSTPGAVRVAVHRLRRRFRTILMEHVSQTVADPAEVDAELRYLAAALNPPPGA
jgi:RNA polymerase sigma-70 factor (ECF subfamily)